MSGVEFDASEFRAFAARVEGAVQATEGQVEQVINRGALNIKNDLQTEMRGSRHFKGVAPGISYDMKTGSAIEAEIGPEKGGPGSLANIAYFGSSRGGGTVPDPIGALEREAPNVEKWLLDVMGKVIE